MKSFRRILSCCGLIYMASIPVLMAQPIGGYDIYVVDVASGTPTQVTSSPADEFNPSFSNNGKKVVYDYLLGAVHDLYVTDLTTGTHAPLVGGTNGCDASWSPDGSWIAFDRSPAGDNSIYYVPAGGGVPIFIRHEANDPHWAPDSDRLVFTAFDGIRTIRKDGSGETLVSNFGKEPVYARNSEYIAFTDGKDIFKIRVDVLGNPIGAPVNITGNPPSSFSNHPSWSNNSKTIVASTTDTMGGDLDIMTIPASGGSFTPLVDVNMEDDFDPCYSKNGKKVVFSGRTELPEEPEFRRPLPNRSFTLQNSPNPFARITNIQYQVNAQGSVSLGIYDLSGKKNNHIGGGTACERNLSGALEWKFSRWHTTS